MKCKSTTGRRELIQAKAKRYLKPLEAMALNLRATNGRVLSELKKKRTIGNTGTT